MSASVEDDQVRGTWTDGLQTSEEERRGHGCSYHRRRLLSAVAGAVGAARLCTVAANAADPKVDEATSTTLTRGAGGSFESLKQVVAGVLNVAYAEAGSPGGRPVILLHGWPYDIHSYVEVAPMLASAGYRVIVPYLRGFGSMHFLSSEAVRNGQQSALAADVIGLLDAVGIRNAIVAGYDWGVRSANIVAALWPERCKALVSVSGYLIGNPETGKLPLPPRAELAWWYQAYFATDRGRADYQQYCRDFAKLIWQTASPVWNFDAAVFDRSATALENPDHVDIVVHNYRSRIGLAPGERQYDGLEERLASVPSVRVPTITLEGDANGAPHPERASYVTKFLGPYAHRLVRAVSGTTCRRKLHVNLPRR